MIWLWAPTALGSGVDAACIGKNPVPYLEQVQTDFLQNYVALAATSSPIHGPIPHKPGHGAVSIDLAVIPPLSCARRVALAASKTEESNKVPVLPRPRITFALPIAENWVASGGFSYLPPMQIAGQRSTMVSGEVGIGWAVSENFQLGGRVHATSMKTIADAATALDPDSAPADDLYLANTFGVDLILGRPIGPVTPYVAMGVTDATTLFWVGDDGVMVNNMHPYFGPVASLGADGLFGRLRLGGELYMAPGGHARPDKSFPNEVGFGGYGHIYTARLRVGLELGQ